MHSLVSVIIPNYNCAPYLRQAVESALAQTYQSLEVVVVDDGSTDESVQAIADLVLAGRVRLVERENGGVAAARNTGIAHSAGSYFVFLDCDDYLHPDMVQQLMALLDGQSFDVFAYCNCIHVDANGTMLPDQRPLPNYRKQLNGNLLAPLLMGGYVMPVSMLISRELVHHIGGFDPQYTGGDDYALLLRASCSGANARYMDTALAFYRHRPGSQSEDTERIAQIDTALLRDTATRFPLQVAAVLPQLALEFRHIVAIMWNDGVERLKHAEAYAGSLQQALGIRDTSLNEAAIYTESLLNTIAALQAQVDQHIGALAALQAHADSLQITLQQHSAAVAEVTAYAHSLEATVQKQNAALAEAATYAASLETALQSAMAYGHSLEATVEERNAALTHATAYARSLEQEREQLVQTGEQVHDHAD